jgi:molybdopterin/thiamine biosynthesis adenylyltransferase
MKTMSTGLPTSISLRGKRIAGAEDRQKKIAGFDQAKFSVGKVVCIGAGGLAAYIAPALCRKGIGKITLIDDDVVEPSNLNRQRFYETDLYQYKAVALVRNLQRECIFETELIGHAMRLEEAIARGIDLDCDVAICGVDNNPARVLASRRFRQLGAPVIFTAVSADGDHGYVFVQETSGPCFGCLFPDAVNSDTYPCPGTPAILDILQAVGALTVYAVDSLLMSRLRCWNYRKLSLSDQALDGAALITARESCPMFGFGLHEPTDAGD